MKKNFWKNLARACALCGGAVSGDNSYLRYVQL